MEPETPIRLLIVDDHVVVAEAMKNLLEIDGFARVVATATSAEEAVVLVERVSCDVVLLDIALPRGDGISCARALRGRVPDVRILVLSMHGEEGVVREALEAGVNGYILKSASCAEVKRAVVDVHAGHFHIAPRLAGLLLGSAHRPPAPPPVSDAFKTLSARERDVLTLIAKGSSNQEAAAHLGLTVNTVKAHLKSIYRKLDVKDRVGMMLHAMKRGLIETPVASP